MGPAIKTELYHFLVVHVHLYHHYKVNVHHFRQWNIIGLVVRGWFTPRERVNALQVYTAVLDTYLLARSIQYVSQSESKVVILLANGGWKRTMFTLRLL